jgi:hypothetical protein
LFVYNLQSNIKESLKKNIVTYRFKRETKRGVGCVKINKLKERYREERERDLT